MKNALRGRLGRLGRSVATLLLVTSSWAVQLGHPLHRRRRVLEAAALAALSTHPVCALAAGWKESLRLAPSKGSTKVPDLSFFYTAESLLLATLPVECPPLSVLKAELEKLYVLRVRPGPDQQRRPAAAESDEYWSVLRVAQQEAASATKTSRQLFQLFFSEGRSRAGSRALDEVEKAIGLLDAPLRARDVERSVELQTAAMRALVRLGNLVGPPPSKFPFAVCKTVACDGLPPAG